MSQAISTRTHKKRGKLLVHFVLIFGAFSMIFPFVWMLLTSFKGFGESIMIPPIFFPTVWRIDNYTKVMQALPFDMLYLNTLQLIFWRILCAIVFSSMAAYGFAKLNFPFRNALFFIVLAQFMLPSQVYIIPQYLILVKLNKLNSMFALVFPGLVSSFGTFFLRQFYLSLPDDLSEASVLDGCNIWKTFIYVLFPLTKTALMALAIFTALFAYSDMMWPLIVNMQMDKMTLAAGISTLQGQFSTKYPEIMAGSALAMVPMMIIYMIFQKHFIEGIALTGTKA